MRPGMLLSVTALALLSQGAQATLLQFTATPNSASFSTEDWTVVFDDDSGDGLFQLSELVSFSGTRVSPGGQSFVYDALVGAPDVAGISTFSGPFADCCWWFDGPVISGGTPGGDGWFASRWSYSDIGPAPAAPPASPTGVPEPGSLGLLFLVGLALVLLGRKAAKS